MFWFSDAFISLGRCEYLFENMYCKNFGFIFCIIFFQNLKHLNLKAIPDLYCICVYFFVFPFIFCHFATNATNRLLSIGDIVYSEIRWYRLPPNLQKYVQFIILRSQVPSNITGLGVVECTMESYATVSKKTVFWRNLFNLTDLLVIMLFQLVQSAYSYFVAIRELSAR